MDEHEHHRALRVRRGAGLVVGKDPLDPNTCWEYVLTPSASGTDVVERYEMRREPWIIRGYYRLVGRGRRLHEAMEMTLRSLKEAAEQQTSR